MLLQCLIIYNRSEYYVNSVLHGIETYSTRSEFHTEHQSDTTYQCKARHMAYMQNIIYICRMSSRDEIHMQLST